MDRFHGKETRGEYAEVQGPPQSPTTAGRFGRMFRRLPVFLPGGDEHRAEGFLRELAETMRDDGDDSGDNDKIPAGYTYVGQFVDHDITFDPTSSLQRANDPQGLFNFRTPRLDLDSVYGRGPADSPYLYDRDSEGNLALLVGKAAKDDGTDAEDDDLPRNRQGRALVGDPRNDENTFVGQFQLSMVKFHNRVLQLDEVTDRFPPGGERMKEAQRIVRWHYQWAVLHDFLPRIVGTETAGKVVLDGGEVKRPHYEPRKNAYMPVEFSVAAYRFGHSQVRDAYRINNTVPELPTFSADPDAGRRDDFRGFRPLPPQWTVSWPFFFELDDDGPAVSRLIDPKLSGPLFTLPGEPEGDQQNLALRNLLRGLRMRLPDGIRVANAIGADPLTADELGFNEPPPLWYYVLKEAEVRHGGEHLGEVGGTIVAEVIAGLVEIDPLSYLSVEPTWTPTLPSENDGDFTFADLLRFAVPDQAQRF